MTINSFDVRPHVILCCGRVVAVTMSDRYDFTWWKPCDPGRKRSLSLAIKGTPSRRFASRSVEGCDTRGRCGGGVRRELNSSRAEGGRRCLAGQRFNRLLTLPLYTLIIT